MTKTKEEEKERVYQLYLKNQELLAQSGRKDITTFLQEVIKDVSMRNALQTRALEQLLIDCKDINNPNELGLKFATFLEKTEAVKYFTEMLTNDNNNRDAD